MAKHPEAEGEEVKPLKKPRQRELDGFEQIEDPALRKKVEDYVECRDARMAATEEEVAAKQELMGEMKRRKLTKMSIDEFLIEIIAESEKLKVKRAGKPSKRDKGD